MGGLAELDFELQWRNGQCRLHDDEVSRNDGLRILQWLEIFHVHHRRKLAVVKTLLADNALVDKKEIGCGSSFDLEDEGDLS